MQTDEEYGLHPLRVGLPHLPWLTLRYVAVAYACQVHCLLLCLAELKLLQIGLHVGLHVLEFVYRLLVHLCQFATLRHLALEILLGQLQGTVYEVAVDSHELRVVALLEVSPCEVVVLRLWRIGCEHIAQHILFAWQVHQVFMQPHSPVA